MRLSRHDAAGGRSLLLLLGLIVCALSITELVGCTSATLPAELRQHQRRAHQVRRHHVKHRPIPHPYPTWRTN
jgi:hypothetical protein